MCKIIWITFSVIIQRSLEKEVLLNKEKILLFKEMCYNNILYLDVLNIWLFYT